MIKHIVIFKLIPPYSGEEKREDIKRLSGIFEPLGRKLDYILEYKVGVNILEHENAGDVVIDSVFSSVADLKRYQSSKEHVDAVQQASSIKKTKTVIDYTI